MPRRRLGAIAARAALAWVAMGCSSAQVDSPQCTSESAVHATDAGVVPPRALPTGYPCATGATCSALVDPCPGDWPDAALAPTSATSTLIVCECPDAVWTCTAASETPPTCPSSVVDAGGDAGGGDG
jgi:hypothetical protein